MTDHPLEIPTDPQKARELVAILSERARNASSEEEARFIISEIAAFTRAYRVKHGIGIPAGPAEQAAEVNSKYRIRPHTQHISDRIAEAVRDVERGINRQLVIETPPRMGKSLLTSFWSPLWMLRRHPEWEMMLISYDGELSGSWARDMRTMIEQKPQLGIALNEKKRAFYEWETLEKGGVYSASTRGSLTGRGARVMIIDDPIRDFVEAHSATMRDNLWNWWLSVALTRLEPPYLVIVMCTRWHEDDLIGRLLSKDYEGNPKDWEEIRIPAIADSDNDQLGRLAGQPLYSPLFEEDEESAVARWDSTKTNVGSYTWSAMYQQRPAPQQGAIFDMGWWRFWTWDPEKATEDGRVVFLDPAATLAGQWVDSWDAAFKGGGSNDSRSGGWVVGQRWMRKEANRYLLTQVRGHWSFTETLAKMKDWAKSDDHAISPWGDRVHERLVEERANGAALIDVMREHVAGIKPINPTVSKEARARVVTPEIESGNVFLPHPSDPGNEWVNDLLSELRNFPHDAADDQVDALTQALTFLRGGGKGGVTVPGSTRPLNGRAAGWQVSRDISRTALNDMAKSRRRF